MSATQNARSMTLALVLVSLGFSPGCTPAGSNGGMDTTEDIGLSTSSAAPGKQITVTHSSIAADSTVTVEFRGADGMAVIVDAVDVRDGAVTVAVPPVVNSATGAFEAGTYDVSIGGVASTQSLSVSGLLDVGDIDPGAVLRLVLEAAVEDYQSLSDRIAEVEAEFGETAESAQAKADIEAAIDELQGQIDELATTGQLVVTLPDGTSQTLGADELGTADQLLVTLLAGVSEVGGTNAKRTSGKDIVDDCLLGTSNAEDRVACLQEVLGEIRIDTGRGTNLASMLGTTVGVVVTLYGIAQTAPLIAVTGILVAVASNATSMANAAVNNQNSDSFANGDREGFDASQESASQIIRLGAEAGGNLPGPIGATSTVVNIGLGVKDVYVGAEAERCAASNKAILSPQMQEAPIEFCIVLQPVGEVVTNVTGEGGASASSTFSDAFVTGNALDGSRSTNWFSDGSTGGDSEVYTWVRTEAADASITRVEVDPETFEGGGAFGFGLAKVSIINTAGATVFETDFMALAAFRVDLDVAIPEGIEGRTVQLLFVDHQDPECGGFSELRIFGLREVSIEE